jgi:hypothetical protein
MIRQIVVILAVVALAIASRKLHLKKVSKFSFGKIFHRRHSQPFQRSVRTALSVAPEQTSLTSHGRYR